MTQLATSFEEYSAWRDGLSAEVRAMREWLESAQLLEGEIGNRLGGAIDRLAEDRLMIAFVAEFSRGKSELINAIFFANYGKRILPSSAGRTTMCPTETAVRRDAAAEHPRPADRDARAPRQHRRVQEERGRVGRACR